LIVRIAVFEIPAREAVIVEVDCEAVPFVLIVNVAVVFPARTVTPAGIMVEDRLLESDIFSPPAGAAELILAVPELLCPADTTAGLKLIDVSDGGLIVREAVSTEPPTLAVRVTAF
jgi:hypothetical protein